MPRICTICQHENRKGIDAALATPESYRSIARRFGVSAPSLFRHWQNKHWKPKRSEAELGSFAEGGRVAHFNDDRISGAKHGTHSP